MNHSSSDRALSLSKFDVAERQLLQAIRMFFAEEDAVSIHTLSEASAQVLYDIGKEKGVFSLMRDHDRIRPERKAEWLAVVFSSRNFFKHANKDAEKVLEFKPVFNDFSLLDAINMYGTLKKRWVPETLMFMVWFGLAHPTLVREETDLAEVLQRLDRNNDDAKAHNKPFFGKAVRALRAQEVFAGNVSLEHGEPAA